MSAARRKNQSEWCSAANCRNARRKCQGLSFFRFPKNVERCKQWVINTKRADLLHEDYSTLNKRGYCLCANHFEDSQFMNAQQRNKLIWSAVPTLFDIPNPPPPKVTQAKQQPKVAASTEKSPSKEVEKSPSKEAEKSPCKEVEKPKLTGRPNIITIRPYVLPASSDKPPPPPPPEPKAPPSTTTEPKKDLRKELKSLRAKVTYLKKKLQQRNTCNRQLSISEIAKHASKYMSPELLRFFTSQMKMGCKQKKGERWSKEDKEWACSLFLQSPRAYRFCQQLFRLPSIKTLQRLLSHHQNGQGQETNSVESIDDGEWSGSEDIADEEESCITTEETNSQLNTSSVELGNSCSESNEGYSIEVFVEQIN